MNTERKFTREQNLQIQIKSEILEPPLTKNLLQIYPRSTQDRDVLCVKEESYVFRGSRLPSAFIVEFCVFNKRYFFDMIKFFSE